MVIWSLLQRQTIKHIACILHCWSTGCISANHGKHGVNAPWTKHCRQPGMELQWRSCYPTTAARRMKGSLRGGGVCWCACRGWSCPAGAWQCRRPTWSASHPPLASAAGSSAPSLPVPRAAALPPPSLPVREGRRLAAATCVPGRTNRRPSCLCWILSCGEWNRAVVSVKHPPAAGRLRVRRLGLDGVKKLHLQMSSCRHRWGQAVRARHLAEPAVG